MASRARAGTGASTTADCPEMLQSHLKGDHRACRPSVLGCAVTYSHITISKSWISLSKNGEIQPTLGWMTALSVVIHISLHTELCLQNFPHPSHMIPPHPQAGGEGKSPSPEADRAAHNRYIKGQHWFSQVS